MKELEVNETSDLLPFSYNTQENLERSDVGTLVGQISRDGALAYLARGTALEIVQTSDGSRRSACNLGSVRENIEIKCLSEFFVGESRKILLGLEVIGWKRNGLLCVFDLTLAKVTRAIWLPQAATSITIIEDVTEMDSNISCLSNDYSKSIVVVGCQGGQVLLLRIGKMKIYDHRNDLTLPADVDYIKLKDVVRGKGLELKASANYCIDLSTNLWTDGSFRYLDHNGKPLRVLKRGDVSVTSLLFLNQAALLVVGYNFGCFQIWDMQSVQPVYSSSYMPSAADVTHLVFQEPENDPRHCCYLLVGRSPSPKTNTTAPTMVTLYQLVFGIKESNTNGYFIYRELEGVCERFEHQLTYDSNHLADAASIGSRIIACSTLARQVKQNRLDQSTGGSSDSEGKHSDTTLSYIVWESPPEERDNPRPSYHLGLFDINKWYHLQMPGSIRNAMYGRIDPVCPFFAFYSLNEVAEVIEPDTLVNCFINARDVSSFHCPIYPTLDQNFWPSSLAFKCCCLAERGIVKTEMLGLQRQILADLVSKGSDVFNESYNLINLCWSVGLIPKIQDLTTRLNDPQVQFDCLMSIAIEHDVMSFIMKCLRDWSRGEITNAGSCLRSMLQWVWKRVIKAKGILDEHYIALFYSENSKLAAEILQHLNNCTEELKKLVQILTALKECQVAITDEGSTSISVKLTVANCIYRYAKAILFLVRSGILPESTETKPLNFKSSFVDDNLFIDRYCKVIEQKILQNDNEDDFGWDGKYPPPSTNTVCKCLLLDISQDDAMSFLYYWILDAEEYLRIGKIAEQASFFFNISKTKKNVIEALWEIDHNHLEKGVEKLMEFGPELLADAMKAVYNYGSRSLACGIYKANEMLSAGDMDWKFCIRVLTENNAVYEAYKLQRKYRESEIGLDLYHYFLEQCMQNNAMAKLFDLHLTDEDEEWLCQFLQDHKNPIAKELLIVFCIKRHRYAEAIRHGANFEKDSMCYEDRSLFGGMSSRKAILHMTNQIILPMQKKLLSYQMPSKSSRLITEVTRPEPLSASIVKRDKVNVACRSDAIFKILHSIEETRLTPERLAPNDGFNLPFVKSANKTSSVGRKRREFNITRDEMEEDTSKTARKAIIKPTFPDANKSDVPLKRRKHLFYGAEAMKLLQTPPVIKDPLHLKHIKSHRTPASILKSNKPRNRKVSAGNSVRKRVVIADPNISISPVKLPESPSQLPESPSCLASEPFKQETTEVKPILQEISLTESGRENAVSNDDDDDDVKRNLNLVLEEDEPAALTDDGSHDVEKETASETFNMTNAILDHTAIKHAEIVTTALNESTMTSLNAHKAHQVKVPDAVRIDSDKVDNDIPDTEVPGTEVSGTKIVDIVPDSDIVDAGTEKRLKDEDDHVVITQETALQKSHTGHVELAEAEVEDKRENETMQVTFETGEAIFPRENGSYGEREVDDSCKTKNEIEAVTVIDTDGVSAHEAEAVTKTEAAYKKEADHEVEALHEAEAAYQGKPSLEEEVARENETANYREAGHEKETHEAPEFVLELDTESSDDGQKMCKENSPFKEDEVRQTVLDESPEIRYPIKTDVGTDQGVAAGEVSGKESVVFVEPEPESDVESTDKQRDILPRLRFDLPSLRDPLLSLTTPNSDLSTPNSELVIIDPNSPDPLSSVLTREVQTTQSNDMTEHTEAACNVTSTDFMLPSLRNFEQGQTVEDMVTEDKGNLKVFVDARDVTKEMTCMDSSFESQDHSFISHTTDLENMPLDFGKEREAAMSRVTTRRRGREKNTEAKPGPPMKKSLSPPKNPLSPTKSNRRSFHTPKRSPKDFGYTPPVTRLSAKKNTPITRSGSKKLLQEIGEHSLLSANISESPISFAPSSDSATKKPRTRMKRYSLQSPLVPGSHGMTLRNRTKKNT